eukprot:TRINITY_DN1886_c0_g1_i2.p1 TRINITY_DN1886_c0_g1~~TRINITY_DN1886_c0_g1_i2.p1  ORF type:complete len:221 (-),score=62.20 TRINITY_DN1886_c0_g1_i2:61-723(-)
MCIRDRYKTLDDLKKDQKQGKDNKEKKNVNTYAGGQKSGIAIEHPESQIDDLFEKAKNQSESNKNERANLEITIYKNGFQIRGEQFRDFKDPQNKQFMEELNKQIIPTELRAKYKNGLNVGIEDKRSEVYQQPEQELPKYQAFSGQGVTLSSNTQPIIQQMNINENKKITLDSTKPQTTIQIRYSNGQASNLQVNHDCTVEQIYAYVKSETGVQLSLIHI